MYSDRQSWANTLDPDEMPQKAVSHQGLHCLPLIQQFLDTTSGSKLYLFKFKNKYGQEFLCPNTCGKYGVLDKYGTWWHTIFLYSDSAKFKSLYTNTKNKNKTEYVQVGLGQLLYGKCPKIWNTLVCFQLKFCFLCSCPLKCLVEWQTA